MPLVGLSGTREGLVLAHERLSLGQSRSFMRTFPTLAGCQEPDAPTDRLGGSCNAEPTCVGGSSSRDAPDAPGLLCLATKSMSDQAVTAFFALGRGQLCDAGG